MSSSGADDIFGPRTLLYEQALLQIIPSALLLLSLPIRTLQLRRQTVKTLRNATRTVKQTFIVIFAATQLALLIAWSASPAPSYRNSASVPAAAVSFTASLALLFLSSIEHTRSIRPSTSINVFLFVSLLFDIPQARTLWLSNGARYVPSIYTAGVAAKAIVLYLEARSKKRSLFPPYKLYGPEALVSIYDRTALWWLNPLFFQGYKGSIPVDELYQLEGDLNAREIQQVFERSWTKRTSKSGRPLLWAIVKSYKLTLLAMVSPRLCLSALRLCQPLLIHSVTSYLADHHNDEGDPDIARGLIAATVLLYVGIAIFNALYRRQLHRFITQLRGSVISAIHSKALRLPADSVSDNAMLTLTSADVSRITSSLKQIDDLFATPLEVGVAIFLLERQVGVSCVAPVTLSILVSAVSFRNSNTAVPLQKSWLAAVSDRVAYTSSVLHSPKGFKMLGLTDYLIERIQTLRLAELVKNAAYRKYVTLRNVESSLPTSFAPPFTLMMLTLIKGGHALTPMVAFTTLSLVSLLTAPIQNMIHAVPMLQTALASLDRIQAFLLLDEITGIGSPDSSVAVGVNESAVELAVVPSAKSSSNKPLVTLDSAVVTYGAEKRTVLDQINLAITWRSLTIIIGPVGAGKSTLLKTILGETELAHGTRSTTDSRLGLAFCAQEPWLPNGRVRDIITAESDFDDDWYRSVTSACCLSTDMSSFPALDDTLIGTKGLSLSGGQKQRLALARAIYARKEILIVDDVLSGLDASTAKHVFEHVFGPRGLCARHGRTVILATHSGTILAGTFDDLKTRQGYLEGLKDNHCQVADVDQPAISLVAPKASVASKVDDALQDLSRRTGDAALYGYYAKSIGWRFGTVIVVSSVTFAFCMQFPSIWVRWWSDSETNTGSPRPLGLWIGVHMALAVAATCSITVHIGVMLVHGVPKSAATIHKQLLLAVMRAPYSFFVKTDSGVTLNRFSSDMSLMEGELAGAVMQTLDGTSLCLIAMILIALSSKYVGLTIPGVLAVLYAIQKFYLRTSRQLRFLDLEAQAPLMTHMSETIPGVSTIRAFGWERQSHDKCLNLLNNAQKPFYLLLCVQRWLNLVLDMVTAAIATIVVALALTVRENATAGSVGVSLLAILSFNEQLNYLINAWTSLETALGAVARCKNFETTTLPEDLAAENQAPPADWLRSAQLSYDNVSASYNEDSKNVLQDVSFSIAPGQKVGVCGRSGSGKSSLILTLLRLLDTKEGHITLDGQDLATIPRQTIRSRITTLPQEVLVVPGSVRDNLSPLDPAVSDARAIAALEKVGLYDLLAGHRDGLDTPIADLALSHGQLQLFAVARALLRPSALLVLDEVTSSVDAASETRMLAALRDGFRDSTVLAVAHRLQTIVDFDQVLVLDGGRIVEVGAPRDLLKIEGGWFRGLWDRGGHA